MTLTPERKLQLRSTGLGIVYAVATLGAVTCANSFVFWEWTWPSEWSEGTRLMSVIMMLHGFVWGKLSAAKSGKNTEGQE